MSKGLEILLAKIIESPSRLMIDRYLQLLADMPDDQARIARALDLSEAVLTTDPLQALRIAFMVHQSSPEEIRAYDLMIEALNNRGRHAKADALRLERDRLLQARSPHRPRAAETVAPAPMPYSYTEEQDAELNLHEPSQQQRLPTPLSKIALDPLGDGVPFNRGFALQPEAQPETNDHRAALSITPSRLEGPVASSDLFNWGQEPETPKPEAVRPLGHEIELQGLEFALVDMPFSLANEVSPSDDAGADQVLHLHYEPVVQLAVQQPWLSQPTSQQSNQAPAGQQQFQPAAQQPQAVVQPAPVVAAPAPLQSAFYQPIFGKIEGTVVNQMLPSSRQDLSDDPLEALFNTPKPAPAAAHGHAPAPAASPAPTASPASTPAPAAGPFAGLKRALAAAAHRTPYSSSAQAHRVSTSAAYPTTPAQRQTQPPQQQQRQPTPPSQLAATAQRPQAQPPVGSASPAAGIYQPSFATGASPTPGPAANAPSQQASHVASYQTPLASTPNYGTSNTALLAPGAPTALLSLQSGYEEETQISQRVSEATSALAAPVRLSHKTQASDSPQQAAPVRLSHKTQASDSPQQAAPVRLSHKTQASESPQQAAAVRLSHKTQTSEAPSHHTSSSTFATSASTQIGLPAHTSSSSSLLSDHGTGSRPGSKTSTRSVPSAGSSPTLRASSDKQPLSSAQIQTALNKAQLSEFWATLYTGFGPHAGNHGSRAATASEALPGAFWQALVAVPKQQLVQTDRLRNLNLLGELLQPLCKEQPALAYNIMLEKLELKRETPLLWGIYLDLLMSRAGGRKALFEVLALLKLKPHQVWATTAWLRLPRIWQHLKVRGFDWQEEAGVTALIKGLERRPKLKNAGLVL